MPGDIEKVDVLEAIGEIVDALTRFGDRIDREVELVVGADGTASLMAARQSTRAGEPAEGWHEIKSFDSIDEMWLFLSMAEAA